MQKENLFFALLIFVTGMVATYGAFFGNWGSKGYLGAKKYRFTPDYILSIFGERFYVIYHKVAAIFLLIVGIALIIDSLQL